MTFASGLGRRFAIAATAMLTVIMPVTILPAEAATRISMNSAEAAEQNVDAVQRLTNGSVRQLGRRSGTNAARAAAACAPVTKPVPLSSTTRASQGTRVNKCAVRSVNAMVAAASRSGVKLRGWGWRDTNRQIALRKQNCGTSHYAIYEMRSSLCSPPTARPGRSMHERGLAIDFYLAGTSRAIPGSSREFRWLRANAYKYGFYNLPSESWHWSTNGH